MEQLVIKVTSEQLEEIRVTILDMDHTYEKRTTNQYESFRIEYGGGVIVAYTSGKIVCNNDESSYLLQQVMLGLEYESDFDIYIGSDEAGKGEWLGPMTIAAVALSPEQANYLRSSGVMDSKDLSPRKIGELSYEIEENCLSLSVVVLAPETFDQMFREFHSEGKNLNDILAWAHTKVLSGVIDELGDRIKNDRVRITIDEFAAGKMEERLGRVLDMEHVDLVQRPRAEDEPSVAAASIIARDAREDWIDKASLRLRVELTGMTLQEARKRPNRYLFSKTVYLEK
ncbi:MAG: hypothetical protein ACTSUB_03110 [Candidatus Thorarchaeota archaeon]